MHTCFDSVQIDYLWEKVPNEISACVINTTSLYAEILPLCVTNNLNLLMMHMTVYSLRKHGVFKTQTLSRIFQM